MAAPSRRPKASWVGWKRRRPRDPFAQTNRIEITNKQAQTNKTNSQKQTNKTIKTPKEANEQTSQRNKRRNKYEQTDRQTTRETNTLSNNSYRRRTDAMPGRDGHGPRLGPSPAWPAPSRPSMPGRSKPGLGGIPKPIILCIGCLCQNRFLAQDRPGHAGRSKSPGRQPTPSITG